ncbi:MAG: T9SS type A sorting domain-containing protein, partial [Bacteroidetes bacterium]|nr:T9SS type A sorting domain-containing protein [Bacteroidota bacterium]
GKTVYSNAGANLSVNTNNLPQADGIYILKAVLDGQTITKKFIISNGNCIFSPANSITKIKSAAIDTSRLPKIKGTYIIKNKLPDDINTIRVIKTK